MSGAHFKIIVPSIQFNSSNTFDIIPLSCAYQYNVLEKEKAEVTILIGCFPYYNYFLVH